MTLTTSNLQKLEDATTRLQECLEESLTYAQAVHDLKARQDDLDKKFWTLYEQVKQSAKKRAIDGGTKTCREEKEAEMNRLDAERKDVADLLKRWTYGFEGVQRSLRRWQAMYVQAIEGLGEEVAMAL